jgi:hypothetical protein
LKLPDGESIFLAFGFQPVTAKVKFENRPIAISTGDIGSGVERVTYCMVSFRQSLRLYDVKINGTPLGVGGNCRTSAPFKTFLNGGVKYVNIFLGGPQEGEIEIPPFSGCGRGGEDLDPQFTASFSGPGNAITMNQDTACIPSEPSTPARRPCRRCLARSRDAY